MNEALQLIVKEALDALSYELFDLTVRGTKSRPLLDVRIERRDGEEVRVEDCARASRAIEARLDGTGIVAERYVLEVSSPGIERPLKKAEDWMRARGKRVEVTSGVLGGRLEADIAALEGEPGSEVLVLRDRKGVERRLPLADVQEGSLVFHW